MPRQKMRLALNTYSSFLRTLSCHFHSLLLTLCRFTSLPGTFLTNCPCVILYFLKNYILQFGERVRREQHPSSPFHRSHSSPPSLSSIRCFSSVGGGAGWWLGGGGRGGGTRPLRMLSPPPSRLSFSCGGRGKKKFQLWHPH
jgi:hypothetical protein